ncbi:MAG: hypothetical protein QOH26_1562, partial [Actinomycetota bacterium]|nr:hypothetical protein [Actinomycetota bacterium]
AAAEYFEGLGEADMIDVVATHYMEAYNNSNKADEGAGLLANRARDSLVAAADRAGSLGSGAQALSLLEKALGITDEGMERGRLLYKAGYAAGQGSRFDVAIEHLLAATELLAQGDDNELLARAQAQLGRTYFLSAKLEEALQLVEAAVQEVQDPTGPAAAYLFTELARIQFFNGEREKSDQAVAKGIAAAERAENFALIADCLITRALSAMVEGRTHECDALLKGALRLSEQHGLVQQELRALINICANETQIDPNACMATGLRGLERARRFGSANTQVILLLNMIEAATRLGRWDWVRGVIDEADETLTNQYQLSNSLCGFEAFLGNIDEAERHLSRYAAGMDPSSAQDNAVVIYQRAVIDFVKGDYERVLEASYALNLSDYLGIEITGIWGRSAVWAGDPLQVRKQLEFMDRTSLRNPWQKARRLTLEAGLAALEGDRDVAIERFTRTLAQWDALEIPLDKALCQMDFAHTVGGPEAATAREEALAFFEDAGNEIFVNKLQMATR